MMTNMPPTQPIQFGRRAKFEEIEQIRTLSKRHFGDHAAPVNPRFCYVDRASIPGFSTAMGKLKGVGHGFKLGIHAAKHGEAVTTELGRFRTPKMLDSWLNRMMKAVDDYAVNDDRTLFHLVRGQAEFLIAKLSETQVLTQLKFDMSAPKTRRVPVDSPARQQPDLSKDLLKKSSKEDFGQGPDDYRPLL